MSLHRYILDQSRPARNAYFSLPDPALLISPYEEPAKAARPKLPSTRVRKPKEKSLADVFGKGGRMTEEKSTQFLLLLLKHSGIQLDLSPIEGGLAQEWQRTLEQITSTCRSSANRLVLQLIA